MLACPTPKLNLLFEPMITDSVNINTILNNNTTLNNNNNNNNTMSNYMANIVFGGGAGNMPDITADDIMADIPEDIAGDITDEMLQEMLEDMNHNAMVVDLTGDSSDTMVDDWPDNLPEHIPVDNAQNVPNDMVDNWLDNLPEQFPVDIPQDLPNIMGYFTVDDMANIMADDIPNDIAGEITADMVENTYQDMVENTYQDMMAANAAGHVPEDEPSDSSDVSDGWEYHSSETCTFPLDLCNSPMAFFGIDLHINRSEGLIEYSALIEEGVGTCQHTITEDIYDVSGNRGTEYISCRILELYFKLNPSSPEQMERISAMGPCQLGALMAELVCERSFEGEGCILAMRKTAAFTDLLARVLQARAMAYLALVEIWRHD